jgi:hypothetical protein
VTYCFLFSVYLGQNERKKAAGHLSGEASKYNSIPQLERGEVRPNPQPDGPENAMMA